MTTRVDGRTSTTSGPTQRTPTVPRSVAGGVEPVGYPRVAVRHHEADAAVGFELGRVAVERGLVVDVVERLHPVVVERDHPVLAVRWRELDHQRLVLGELEVPLVPGDLGILEVGGVGQLGLVGEHVGPLRLPGRPLRTDLSDALDVVAGIEQREVQLLGRQGSRRRAVVVHALDAHLGMALVALVKEGLADGDAPSVRIGAQPVPRMLPLRNDHLEAAVGLYVHLLLVQRGARAGATAAEARTREEVEADPLRLAARAPDAVVVLPVERSAEIMVVRVLRHDLDGLVAHADQLGLGGPAVLEPALQRPSQQPGEHAVPLGTVERVVGIALGENGLAGVGEEVTELPPRRAVHDLLGDLVHWSLPP